MFYSVQLGAHIPVLELFKDGLNFGPENKSTSPEEQAIIDKLLDAMKEREGKIK